MKIFLVVILILMSIYLFAKSGPQISSGVRQISHNPDPSSASTLPARTNLMFAAHDLTANNYSVKTTVPETTPAGTTEEKSSSHNKLTVYPNAEESLLWVQAEKDADLSGMDVQIYNSAGKRVFYSKLESSLQKVDLCCYENGKYVIKIGSQVYRMMLIQ